MDAKQILEINKKNIEYENYIWMKNISFDSINEDHDYEKLELNKSNNTIEYTDKYGKFTVIISINDFLFTINEHFEEEYFATEYKKTFDSMRQRALDDYNKRIYEINLLEEKIHNIIEELKKL